MKNAFKVLLGVVACCLVVGQAEAFRLKRTDNKFIIAGPTFTYKYSSFSSLPCEAFQRYNIDGQPIPGAVLLGPVHMSGTLVWHFLKLKSMINSQPEFELTTDESQATCFGFNDTNAVLREPAHYIFAYDSKIYKIYKVDLFRLKIKALSLTRTDDGSSLLADSHINSMLNKYLRHRILMPNNIDVILPATNNNQQGWFEKVYDGGNCHNSWAIIDTRSSTESTRKVYFLKRNDSDAGKAVWSTERTDPGTYGLWTASGNDYSYNFTSKTPQNVQRIYSITLTREDLDAS